MTVLLQYIDLFSVECPKRSNYASNFFQNSSIIPDHYAQNYSGIIKVTLKSIMILNQATYVPHNLHFIPNCKRFLPFYCLAAKVIYKSAAKDSSDVALDLRNI